MTPPRRASPRWPTSRDHTRRGEAFLTLQQAAELTRLIDQADSFFDARTLLEDTPDDVSTAARSVGEVDALDVAAEEANEEVNRYKEALGFSKT